MRQLNAFFFTSLSTTLFDTDILIHKTQRNNCRYLGCNRTNHDQNSHAQLHCHIHPMDQFPMGILVDRTRDLGNRDHKDNQRASWRPKVCCMSFQLVSPATSPVSRYRDHYSSMDTLSAGMPHHRNPGSNCINRFSGRTILDSSTRPMDASHSH